ncbi:helix-turn-helix domain-containing protein [Cohnella abietis]|uniref:HTH araC/xylS-type domain-containing protein n=1 Tax=Cohnella abietis TaxID=2507935 RepID=A0A3T1DBY1_9BACL|nr:AraC family transcriptional regulator [Cohnella abietis]BBI35613.1 hypothetical protein KCTCHS21_50120 [Cohnella abietis]
MYLDNLSPYVREAVGQSVHPPWKIVERCLFDYQLLYLERGTLYVTIEGEVYEGRSGDIFLFKPRQTHSVQIMGNEMVSIKSVNFDLIQNEDSADVRVSTKTMQNMTAAELKHIRADITEPDSNWLPNFIRTNNSLIFENCLNELLDEYELKLPYYAYRGKTLLADLWVLLLRAHYKSDNAPLLTRWEELHRAKQFIESHADTSITLDNIADYVKMSRFHLLRQFSQLFHYTPLEYHQKMRIGRAKELMKHSHMKVGEIAERLGFINQHTFSRSFKRVVGVSPSEYRGKK